MNSCMFESKLISRLNLLLQGMPHIQMTSILSLIISVDIRMLSYILANFRFQFLVAVDRSCLTYGYENK